MRKIRLWFGVPLLLIAALMIGCNEETKIKPVVEAEEELLDLWTVFSEISRPDPDCPCCPIGRYSKAGMREPCCPCDLLLISTDAREWKTHWEKMAPTSFERSEFFFNVAARPDPDCPCCPIGRSYLAIRDSVPCCLCAIVPTSGHHVQRQWDPRPLPEDLHDLITSNIIIPTIGRIFVTATCDVERDQSSSNSMRVELALTMGEMPEGTGSEDRPSGKWDIPPGSAEAGYTNTVTLRGEFPVTAGEMSVSLLGKASAPSGNDRAVARSLSVTFVPDPDAGPIESQ